MVLVLDQRGTDISTGSGLVRRNFSASGKTSVSLKVLISTQGYARTGD